MYKNIKTTAMLFIATASMFALGCTKEEGRTPVDESFVMQKADITYRITLDASTATALEKAYDATVQYYDADGQIKTVTPFTPTNLTWELPVTMATFPGYYGLRLNFIPKSDLSELAEDESVDLVGKLQADAKATATNGKTRSLISINQDFRKMGVHPQSGRAIRMYDRVKVQKDGSSESTMSWPE